MSTMVATLTMNPAVDLNTRVAQVTAERKLRCDIPTREPGGGGLNVSRALAELGVGSTAWYLAGGPTGDLLSELLSEQPFSQQRIQVEGWTRENVNLTETSTGRQFRFGLPGAPVSTPALQQVLSAFEQVEPAPDFLVVSGSLPPGAGPSLLAPLAELGRRRGAKVLVDTSGVALAAALDAGVYLIAPNLREIRELAGDPLPAEEALEGFCLGLVREGKCQAILLSLGAAGALLTTRAGLERIRAPTVPIASKVGAGDSALAGLVAGLVRGWPVGRAARLGVAAGAAAVMTEGTRLCRREDTERLFASLEGERAG